MGVGVGVGVDVGVGAVWQSAQARKKEEEKVTMEQHADVLTDRVCSTGVGGSPILNSDRRE